MLQMVIENLIANFICMVLVYVNCNTSMYVYSIGLSVLKLHSSACNGVIVQPSKQCSNTQQSCNVPAIQTISGTHEMLLGELLQQ